MTSSYNGYINYYAREGERVGANQLVCTVDESGQIKEILDEQNADNTSLSESDMRELRTKYFRLLLRILPPMSSTASTTSNMSWKALF